jgi:hypothetical protein
MEPLSRDDIVVDEMQLVSDDEGDAPAHEDPTSGWEEFLDAKQSADEFDLDGPTPQAILTHSNKILDKEDRIGMSAPAELLRAHYQCGHISFPKLQEMAKCGILPSRLAKCKIPVCSACQYCKATRRPWRPRTAKNFVPKKPSKPGEVVSVDQLVSPTPGLVAQLSGFITKERYKYATVYVDQYSGLGFVWLQKSSSAEETLESKRAFEQYALDRGVVIQAYHADNGIFRAEKWVQACSQKQQGLTFAAVGAHHTNGKAERRIRELQEMARTALAHANCRWPTAINAHLWPYAVCYANDCINAAPNMQDPQ